MAALYLPEMGLQLPPQLSRERGTVEPAQALTMVAARGPLLWGELGSD